MYHSTAETRTSATVERGASAQMLGNGQAKRTDRPALPCVSCPPPPLPQLFG